MTTADSGAGSLRQAILDSNASVGVLDTIAFNINGGGVQTIAPLTQLPDITDPVIIDGTTQPGFAGKPLIELSGAGITTGGAEGLRILAGGSTVRGLVINRFPQTAGVIDTGDGIELVSKGGNVIQGNYLGTDVSGAVAEGNASDGVFIENSPGNTIGGTTAAQRNIIAGQANSNGFSKGVEIYQDTSPTSNASGNLVEGNYIGTDVTGTKALANTNGIELEAPGNTVGGTGRRRPQRHLRQRPGRDLRHQRRRRRQRQRHPGQRHRD